MRLPAHLDDDEHGQARDTALGLDVARHLEQGHVRFMGVCLRVARGAPVPRPETELLGHAALGFIAQQNLPNARIVDMGAGAGNLACALATLIPDVEVWATDLTAECHALTARNVVELGLSERVRVLRGDLFEPLARHGLEGRVDLVVCNPPHVSEKRLDADLAGLLDEEPREAFAAGPYGMSIHQRVIEAAPSFLRIGGALAFEFGLGQDRQLKRLFERTHAFDAPRIFRDRSGQPRAALAVRRA